MSVKSIIRIHHLKYWKRIPIPSQGGKDEGIAGVPGPYPGKPAVKIILAVLPVTRRSYLSASASATKPASMVFHSRPLGYGRQSSA